MKKIIRLTESDLSRIVKRIILEETDVDYSNRIEDVREELKDVWVKISRMIKLIDNDDSLSSEEKHKFKSNVKKLIRPLSLLRENDLTRIVRRVLKEQTNTMEPLSPAVQIGIKDDYHNEEPVFWDLTEIYRGPTYCEFRGKPRGESPNRKMPADYGYGFIYNCKEKTFVSNMKGDNRTISDKANERVRTACGCDQYVKNPSSTNSNVA
jgi:hypothetical protein